MREVIYSVPRLPEDGLSLDRLLRKIHDDLICQALIAAKGNKSQAARLLRIKRTTLLQKMRTMGMKLNDPCLKAQVPGEDQA